MPNPIKLSLKGLANYMISSSARQRKILQDYKYPDPEGRAQAIYYREARDFIVAYHKNGHPQKWLNDRADNLQSMANMSTGQTKTRLGHNARALRQYSANFSKKKFKILKDVRFVYRHSGVKITIVPDLHVMEEKKEKIIKLEFSEKPLDEKVIKTMTQLMYEAQDKEGKGLTSACVLFLDVTRGLTHKGARAGSRILGEIEAACDNIAAIWPSV